MSSQFGNMLGPKPTDPSGGLPWDLGAPPGRKDTLVHPGHLGYYPPQALAAAVKNGVGGPFVNGRTGFHTSPGGGASWRSPPGDHLGLGLASSIGVRLPTAPSFWSDTVRQTHPSPGAHINPSPGGGINSAFTTYQQHPGVSPHHLTSPPTHRGHWSVPQSPKFHSPQLSTCRPSPSQISPQHQGLVHRHSSLGLTNQSPVNGAMTSSPGGAYSAAPEVSVYQQPQPTTPQNGMDTTPPRTNGLLMVPPSAPQATTSVASQEPQYTSCLELGLMESEVNRAYANSQDQPRALETPPKPPEQPETSPTTNGNASTSPRQETVKNYQSVTPPLSENVENKVTTSSEEKPITNGENTNVSDEIKENGPTESEKIEMDEESECQLAIAEEPITPVTTAMPRMDVQQSPIEAAAAALFKTPEAETLARQATMEYTKALMLSIEDQNMEAARRLEAKIANEARKGEEKGTPPSPRFDPAHLLPQEHFGRGVNPAVASFMRDLRTSTHSGTMPSQEFVSDGSSPFRPRPFALEGLSPLRAGSPLTSIGFSAAPSIATFTASAIGSASNTDDLVLSQKLTSCSPSGNLHTCNICGFQATTKFHINSHMNTHFDHKCRYCDYTSRTEGRLKAHMKNFHTHPVKEEEGGSAAHEGTERTGSTPADTSLTSNGPEPNSDSLTGVDIPTSLGSMGSPPGTGAEPSPEQYMESEDEPGVFISQSGGLASLSGKPKTYKCKQCPFVAQSKNEYWTHARTHIKKDKQLKCTKCLFVTEYKHHLEYHLRNHYGSKPFRCTKCNYSCVNKSMLNSHMKSHSNFYPYRCANCTYATKYCHSLKLHLRKYNHHPATVVNPDGSTTDAMTIDIYGNRRGPRQRKLSDHMTGPGGLMMPNGPGPGHELNFASHLLPSYMEAAALLARRPDGGGLLSNSIPALGATLPTISSLAAVAAVTSGAQETNLPPTLCLTGAYRCSLCDFSSNHREDLTLHLSTNHFSQSKTTESLEQSFEAILAQATGEPQKQDAEKTPSDGQQERSPEDSSPRVASHPTSGTPESGPPKSPGSGSGSGGKSGDESGDGAMGHGAGSSRRKGRAFKLDRIAMKLTHKHHVDGSTPQDEGESPTLNPLPTVGSELAQYYEHMETVVSHESAIPSSKQNGPVTSTAPQNVDWNGAFVCPHCEMAFKDNIMYSLHMGYHGFEDPFRCNNCGVACQDRLQLFMHIAREQHM